jgi:uridine phosphorylase
VRHHLGLTCTTADFYAGQGRMAPGFPVLEPHKVARLSQAGVLNLEMEMAAYLTLAAVATVPIRAGGACLVLNNRVTGQGFPGAHARRRAERRLIDVGLRALEFLAAVDQREPNAGA